MDAQCANCPDDQAKIITAVKSLGNLELSDTTHIVTELRDGTKVGINRDIYFWQSVPNEFVGERDKSFGVLRNLGPPRYKSSSDPALSVFSCLAALSPNAVNSATNTGAGYFETDVDKAGLELIQFTVSTGVRVLWFYDSREGYNSNIPNGFQRLPQQTAMRFTGNGYVCSNV